MEQVIGQWRRQFSNSKKKFYWFNQSTGQSLWADDSLPHGWAFEVQKEGAEPVYVHLTSGTRQAARPSAPATGPATASAPAAQISFQASQTAGDDLQSTAYIPDPHCPSGPGMNVPEKVRSKRDYLLGYGIPEADRWNLQVDEVALYSITEGRQAERMTEAIVEAVRAAWARSPWCTPQTDNATVPSVQPLAFTITDATAAVGGNVLSFARHPSVSHVHAIELSAQRAAMCAHNARVARVNGKVSVHQGDSIATIQHASWLTDVIFMDPPWGGPAYASAESLDMFLGPTDVSDWTVALTTPGGTTGSSAYEGVAAGYVKAKFVAIKAPMNYNVAGLRQKLAKAGTGASIVLHQPMHKMQLLIVQAADSLKLHVPALSNKRQRDEDGEAMDGPGSKRGKGHQGGTTGANSAGASDAAGTTGSTNAGAGSGPAGSSAITAPTSSAGTTSSSASGPPSAAFELLVRASTSPYCLTPTGLFLRPSQSQGKMVLQKGMQSLLLTATEGSLNINIPGAPVLPCAAGLRCQLEEGYHKLTNAQGDTLMVPLAQMHRLVEGQPLTYAPVDNSREAAFTPCIWRLHAAFDVENAIFTGSVPSAIMHALCIPTLSDKAIAGEGQRGRVSRGMSSIGGSQVVKVQPMDDRVVEELRLLSILRRSEVGPASSSTTGSACPALCTPTAIVLDKGRWMNSSVASRCLYVQPDAGKSVEELLGTCGGRLRMDVAGAVFKRVLEALAHLHRHALLHADVSAGNVLVPSPSAALTPDSAAQAQLIDLGSVRLMTLEGDHRWVYRGKPRGGRWDIMAPEQFGPGKWGDGEVTLTPASDLYAAAGTIVHLLLGFRPFNPAGAEAGAKMTAEACKNAPLRDPVKLASAIRSAVAASESGSSDISATACSSERFLTVLLSCLHTKPEDRPQSATAVLEQLLSAR